MIKFADDTSVVGLISNNDETHYRDEVAPLAEWCDANNLSLDVGKTKEVTKSNFFVQFKVFYTQVSGPVQTTCSNTLSSIHTRHFHTLLCVHNPTKDSVIYVLTCTKNYLTLFPSQLLDSRCSLCTCTVFAKHLYSLYFLVYI